MPSKLLPVLLLGIQLIFLFLEVIHSQPVNQGETVLRLNLLLRKIFQLPSKHPTHHISLEVVHIRILKLLHHLLKLSISDQFHKWILVLHEANWVVLIVVRVR
jgi:hypothetical protein